MLNPLYISWNVDPDIITLGWFHLRWYSILFVSGLFPIGYLIMRSFYKREGLPVSLLDPMLYALLIGTLVGARLGHCLFYDPAYYLAHPLDILKTWEGGLASHGGSVGVLLAMWWFTAKYGKKYGFGYIWTLDRLVIAICFAGCLIRLGNLFNSEIFGHATTLPWGFKFPRSYEWQALYGPAVYPPDGVACHPTQLYEALSYLLLGLGLLWLYLKRLPRLYTGNIFGLFLIGLFGVRILIEFVKNPQEDFEKEMVLNMGQWLSIPFVLAGVIILILSFVYRHPAQAGAKTGTKIAAKK
ncbi:MAG: prolipoprotein diacylglyceryl transferase [Bacteroidales bacterium]|nr:prolipoprotein diacylglyceryl transferase [Bacteroidales bacterium]